MYGAMFYPLSEFLCKYLYVLSMCKIKLLGGRCHQCNVISMFLEKGGCSHGLYVMTRLLRYPRGSLVKVPFWR